MANRKHGKGEQPKLDHSLNSIKPAPENEDVYRPIAHDDPEIRELAKSIKEHGIVDPLLISLDGFIISEHRRHTPALIAGLREVPVKIYPISRKEDPEGIKLSTR
jgi:ParB-like chromosome segregation protein Spo0J